jgi:hypothetical protein
MKLQNKDFEGFDRVERSKTIPSLVAWPTSESSCRIQCADPDTTKRVAKLPDCNRVGYSVKGAWIQIYALPYTIDWVSKKVIHKWTPDFPRKTVVSKTNIAPPEAISSGKTSTATP